MQRFLIIQTAYIGDVILATAVIEKLHTYYPESQIDFLLRKGNETLLTNHPFIHKVYIWDKKQNKINNLFSIVKQLRTNKYNYTINLHRFASSGLIAVLSGSKQVIGFDKNPFSFLYAKKIKHQIDKLNGNKNGKHEVGRNQELIESITDSTFAKPKLYPSPKDFEKTKEFKTQHYVCIAPTSVWFTKQFPKEKWVELILRLPDNYIVYLLGAERDSAICEEIIKSETSESLIKIVNLAGKLSFLESAALMKDATMNYVNDSAPMHIASSMNAPVTAIYCSTVPSFGFGPLSDISRIIETTEKLDCRPCGLHGYKFCPKGHFKCAYDIDVDSIIK